MAQPQQHKEIEQPKTKFLRLRDQWVNDTKYSSSAHVACKHPAYQLIIQMGPQVLPWIIEDIKEENTVFWYDAIYRILGTAPEIPRYAAGRMSLVNQLYVAWWEDREITASILEKEIDVIENTRRKDRG